MLQILKKLFLIIIFFTLEYSGQLSYGATKNESLFLLQTIRNNETVITVFVDPQGVSINAFEAHILSKEIHSSQPHIKSLLPTLFELPTTEDETSLTVRAVSLKDIQEKTAVLELSFEKTKLLENVSLAEDSKLLLADGLGTNIYSKN